MKKNQADKHHTGPSVSFVCAALLFMMVIGCAGLAGKGRLAKFSEIQDSYQQALEMSDYRLAFKFVDSAKAGPAPDYDRYANIKVVRYQITDVNVSDDKRSVEQNVELEYFLLNRPRIKKVNDHQVWRFKEQENVWMLQTGLPQFYRKK